MPVGVLLCNSAILVGGILGGLMRKRASHALHVTFPKVFGLCSIAIGVTTLIKVSILPVVIISMLFGTLLGELLRMDHFVTKFFGFLLTKLRLHHTLEDDKKMAEYVTIVVLFCTGGAGLFGALDAGITGDISILTSKAVMDLFTAFLFATSLGFAVSLAAVFQAIVLIPIFFLAQFIMPLMSQSMIGDFSAVGGLIAIAAGLKLCNAIDIKLVNLIPALIIVAPLSYAWTLIF